MPCAPVISTQRASSSRSAWASASRVGWSSALRLAGLAMVRRATWSAGWSSSSLPPASSPAPAGGDQSDAEPSVEDNERVAFVDRLALLAEDLPDRPAVLGLDRHLHLHRLQDDDGVALLDRVADLHLDLPDRAGDVRLDIGQRRTSSVGRGRIAAGNDPPVPVDPLDTIVIVSAYQEADRLESTLAALAEAFPGARVLVADDGSRDGTDEVALRAGVELVRTARTIGKGGAMTRAAERVVDAGARVYVL